MGAVAPGQLPRDEKQVSNALKFQENQDDEMMQKAKTGDDFVHDIGTGAL